jgi:hypothetical protein
VATTTIQTTAPRGAGKAAFARIGAGIGAGFAAVMRFLCDLSAARRCAIEVEQLMAQSDAELARRGIRRGEIVSYVLRKHMHD